MANNPRLLLTLREAAKAMSVSERLLWSMTAPRGELPAIRIGRGRSIRYAVEDLQRWIHQQRDAQIVD